MKDSGSFEWMAARVVQGGELSLAVTFRQGNRAPGAGSSDVTGCPFSPETMLHFASALPPRCDADERAWLSRLCRDDAGLARCEYSGGQWFDAAGKDGRRPVQEMSRLGRAHEL